MTRAARLIPVTRWTRRARVATIFRTPNEDKVQLDVMRGSDGADHLGGGSLLLNLCDDHGLNPGDVVIVKVERV